MSNVVGCQCRPPMSIPSGRISRFLDSTHLHASGRNLTNTHLARGLAIRCEFGRFGRQGRATRRTKLKKIKLSSKGFLSAEIKLPLIPSSTSSYVYLGRPVAASNFDEAADSATQAAGQLSQSLKDLGRYVSSYNNAEDIQKNLKSVNQSIVALAEKAAEISTSVASNIRSQTSASANLKNLESLQEAFGNVSQSLSSIAQRSVDLSTAALSTAPTDFKGVQGQIDQITSTLNSNLRLEALQESVDSARQSLTAALQEASLGSSSPMLRSSISNGSGKGSSLEHVGASVLNVLHNAQILASEVGTRIVHLPTSGIHFDASSISAPLEHAFTQLGTSVSGISSASPWLTGGMDSSALATSALLATLATSGAVVSSFKLAENTTKSFVEGQDLPLRYDAGTIGAYFRKRPLDIFLRSVRILFSCSTLVFNILLDKYVGRDQELERLRATQMVELIAGLGPTAIKIGQALSIRPDILPVVYLDELQKLQDRVPPFSNEDAKRLILEGLGKPVEDIFSELSIEPIAAASLGQVYKGRLRETGDVVAVKVQRPGVLEGISRDLFLLRQGARVLELIPTVQSDLVALIDTWAIRFFDELDYVQEARNAIRFAEDMKLLPNVTVPGVYLSYTSRKVLVSAWIEGEKLSETKAADLLPLIRTALNCYLMQLLESGFLHADPHPGNLLRTPDGRLCVLDFGLMTEVTEDQRYTLIEYISHLVNSDYARVAEDLVRLGFVPPEFVDPEKTASVVPQLSRVLGQLTQGGGARKVNVQQITNDLANISKDYVFVIPPYFALILRAFSVLEGIGLDADPDYTIVDECYPYISKRLLTDDSPRTRVALQYFLYGGKSQLDATRVEEIISGFQNFRELMVPATGGEGPPPKLEPIDPATKEALLLLFSPEGSFVQDLLLTELVRTVDALSRQAIAELWSSFATSIQIPLPAGLRTPGSWPLPLPGLLLGSSPTARLTEEDVKSLETVRRIWTLVGPQVQQQNSFADIFAVVQDGLPFFRDLLPGVTTSAQKFFMLLLQRQALRLADDLEAANTKSASSSHIEDAARLNTTPILPAPVRVREDMLLNDKLKETAVLQLEAKEELQQDTTLLQLEGGGDLKGTTILQLEGAR
ncbi:hypothetical protein KC19_3G215800 [Ceratodon purpureus]|uniref:Protein kinase domain-containing protein n=1 Tax=Ceratodon purpureus TaxID=3225 RepID=A0A8T0IL86_CERPU|nr:hypothetical protein KC19_3G215800 [Ceratodon purpureus]